MKQAKFTTFFHTSLAATVICLSGCSQTPTAAKPVPTSKEDVAALIKKGAPIFSEADVALESPKPDNARIDKVRTEMIAWGEEVKKAAKDSVLYKPEDMHVNPQVKVACNSLVSAQERYCEALNLPADKQRQRAMDRTAGRAQLMMAVQVLQKFEMFRETPGVEILGDHKYHEVIKDVPHN